jgi:hypothetical protein
MLEIVLSKERISLLNTEQPPAESPEVDDVYVRVVGIVPALEVPAMVEAAMVRGSGPSDVETDGGFMAAL